MLIARTQPKESIQYDNTVFYTEYRVRQMDKEEVDEYDNLHRTSLWKQDKVIVLEQRFVCDTNNVPEYHNWQIMQFGESEYYVVNHHGGTDYWQAESLHELHRVAVERYNRYIELRAQLTQVEDILRGIRSAYEETYISELKKRRLYSKSLRDEAPEDKIAKIKKPLLEKFKQERDALLETRISLEKQIAEL